ncbi:hypothetical protein [Zhongshania sp. BJYM1]|uniref:hypothetical protein n=1 Tax=Zhongshania aquatica TaxID=2965069 RepID=UPI0022B3BA9F|nr:hypothetical protein [Marortus sp. BJYM1]
MEQQNSSITVLKGVVVLMALCLLAGLVLGGELIWQQLRVSDEAEIVGAATDLRSQREDYLERKVLVLASSFMDVADLRVSVQTSNGSDGRELKTVFAIVNSDVRNSETEQFLNTAIRSGLALNDALGDQLTVQFHAFQVPQTNKNFLFVLEIKHRLYLVLGLLLFGTVGLTFSFHRYRQSRVTDLQLDGDYRDQLTRFKSIADEEPSRVASVLSEWLNGAPS